MDKAHVHVGSHGCNALVEKAVGHRGIQERGNDSSVENTIVTLELIGALERRGDRAVLAATELQTQ